MQGVQGDATLTKLEKTEEQIKKAQHAHEIFKTKRLSS